MMFIKVSFCEENRGWCEGVMYLMSRGVKLILAYSWARPAILVAGKGRGGCFYFFCFFTFIPVPLSFLSLSFISSTISFLPFSGRWHKMTHKGWHVVKPQFNQSKCEENSKKKNHLLIINFIFGSNSHLGVYVWCSLTRILWNFRKLWNIHLITLKHMNTSNLKPWGIGTCLPL